MGSTFDIASQLANQRQMERQRIHEQQRVEQQNTTGAQLLDAINNASNIKPTTKDPNGNEIPNPAYAQAQIDKRNLLGQYMALNSPEQHASFADRLHGLIFGHPTDQHQQPALSPNSSPIAPSAPQPSPAPPATDALGIPYAGVGASPSSPEPIHPFDPNHPAVSKISEGIAALGNHLKAFAQPNPQQVKPDAATIAQYYRDPGEVAAERAQALWGERGQNALAVAQERTKALMASLNARPPRMLSQSTIPDLLQQMAIDPTMQIFGPNGQQLTPAQLAELPQGTIAREFKAGNNVFYALGDQNSKTVNVGGMIYQVPSVGEIAGNATALGAATSTLPKTVASSTTDPFGLTTNTSRTSQVATTPGITATPAPGPVSSAAPTLQRRTPQDLSQVNANIAQANATSSKLNKGKPKAPVSAAAPSAPVTPANLPPLDDNGHIPMGVGNPYVRQFANDLLDGKDSKDLGNPRYRGAAEALASQYGWEQGKFTPRELGQIQVFQSQLDQLKDPKNGFLSLYNDNFMKRGLVADFLLDSSGQAKKGANQMMKALESGLLNHRDEAFITAYNQAVGRIQALGQLTRGAGRGNEAQTRRFMSELPDPARVHSSKDALEALNSIQEEINTALQKKQWGEGGPVSKAAPKAPGTWKAPADAPPAPKENGRPLMLDGKTIAVSSGGKWVQP